jgi:hypothetical protein
MTSSRTCVERSIAFQPSETHPPQAHNLAVGHAQTRHLRWSRRAPIVRIENWCSVEHAFVERDVGGRAVVFDTGWSGLFGTPEDARGRRSSPSAPHLMSPHLTEQRVTLVGIDSLNIDDVESGGELTAHPLLLAAGIHAVENLTLLHELPVSGATIPVIPPKMEDFGTFPWRSFARTSRVAPAALLPCPAQRVTQFGLTSAQLLQSRGV